MTFEDELRSLIEDLVQVLKELRPFAIEFNLTRGNQRMDRRIEMVLDKVRKVL